MLALADVGDADAASVGAAAANASAYIATANGGAVCDAVFALSVPASASGLGAPAPGVVLLGAIGSATLELQSLDGAATPYVDLAVAHTAGVAMDASDASLDDRIKMFYHEVR